MKKVLCLYWQAGDTLAGAVSGTLRRLGCQVEVSLHGFPLPEGVGMLFAYGPMGRLATLQSELLRLPAESRPELVFWQTEQFPDPRLPGGLVKVIGDVLASREKCLEGRGNRFRYLGELRRLKSAGLLTVLGVTSSWTRTYLTPFNLAAETAYIGHCAEWGADLELERNIPVLWIGKPGSERRGKLLLKLRDELALRRVPLLMIDGIHRPPVLGEERTKLFNRARITINFMRQPWDDNSMRYFLAAPNKTMIVTEPTLPHTPFLNGVHLVEAKIDAMADTVCYYLAHENARREVAENAWKLVSQDLTMERSISCLLDKTSRTRGRVG